MLKLFRAFVSKPAAPVAVPFDIPAHKGFVATVRVGGLRQTAKFATLKEAQIWIMQRHQFAREFAAALGRSKPAPRAYSIRNLETGKFAPYLWQLTRAEIAA